MDKKVIFSVAGSGKTSLIVKHLTCDKRTLLITYTRNNEENLRKKVIEKFGCIPQGIRIYSYFTFLHSFCYKPFCALKMRTKGINWQTPPDYTQKLDRKKRSFYVDSYGRLYHNRIAKLLGEANLLQDINLRLEKYFDELFVDEVQDFAGHDFNFLASLCRSKLVIMLVGDYFQHTFDTSRDGNTNQGLHKSSEKYLHTFRKMGLEVDSETLNKSYRCSPSVCEFISDKLRIAISSHRDEPSNVKVIEDEKTIEEKFHCEKTVKLFYQNHYQYPCFSQNWGASKGQDHYEDVCVVLNQRSYELLCSGELHTLNPQTRNNLYVACSRARNDLYLTPEHLVKKYKRA